jgi:diguanylate cyclase (GGDEF)-like protein
MLCADVTLYQAQARLENLVKQLAGTRLEVSAGTSVTLTISCGLSELSPGDTVESLLERADTALYQAKRHGRNRVVACSKPTLRELRDDSAFGAPSR